MILGGMASLISLAAIPAHAENPGLKTILGAQLLRAADNTISADDYQKLSFNRCASLKKYVGFSDTPLGQATEYSCKGLNIGITLYAGKDLGKHSPEKVAQLFKSKLAEEAMTAEVFIKPNHEYGTVMAFFINGESYFNDYIIPMEAIKNIDTLAAEARLFYFKNEQITPHQLSEWIKYGKAP